MSPITTKDNDNDNNEDKCNDEYDDDTNTHINTITNTVLPDALFISEDDALCVDDTKQHIMELLQLLPESWDILMMGGKPFSYLTNNSNTDENMNDKYYEEDRESVYKSTEEKEKLQQEIERCNDEINCPIFRHYACARKFGTSSPGPSGTDSGVSGGGVVGATNIGTIDVHDLELACRALQPFYPIQQPYEKK